MVRADQLLQERGEVSKQSFWYRVEQGEYRTRDDLYRLHFLPAPPWPEWVLEKKNGNDYVPTDEFDHSWIAPLAQAKMQAQHLIEKGLV